ncbi:MAG: two-component system OmpR family sensor kinase [Glaciecola sp.]|jgi:two-component system OmpR family sensor kinase
MARVCSRRSGAWATCFVPDGRRMKTPSLERRVNRAALCVIAAVILTLDLVVWLALSASLNGAMTDALELRSDVVRDAAARTVTVLELANELTLLGIPGSVSDVGGDATSSPAVIRSRPGEELILDIDPTDVVSASVVLEGGRRVQILVSRAGARATQRRLLLVEALTTVAALAAASALLRRGTARALAPLDEVVAAAQLTTDGHAGHRLEPDDPTTELGRLAVAYDRMLDELEAAIATAKDAEESGRQFLADAAHQLRTPLASIRASVELILTEPDPRRRDDHLGHLVRETSRGARVLSSLLTLARLDRGRALARNELDVLALCRDEVERTESLAPQLAISIVDARVIAGRVIADGDAIHEALANLLDNARHHASSLVEVHLSEDEDFLAISVRDDGPGVAAESREQIFQRFATLDGKGGSGLGLPIARAVAQGHGGDLVHDGHAFVLSLPHSAASQPVT